MSSNQGMGLDTSGNGMALKIEKVLPATWETGGRTRPPLGWHPATERRVSLILGAAIQQLLKAPATTRELRERLATKAAPVVTSAEIKRQLDRMRGVGLAQLQGRVWSLTTFGRTILGAA